MLDVYVVMMRDIVLGEVFIISYGNFGNDCVL